MIEANVLQQNNMASVDISKPKNRLLFIAFISVFLLLIFVKNDLRINIPVSFLLVFYVGFACLCDRDELIALCVCCIPLSTVFQYKYAILLIMVIYFIKYREEVRITSAAIPLVCLMGWELAHGLVYDINFMELFRDFAELILCTFIIMLSNKKFDHAFIFRSFAACAVGLMIIMLIRLLMQNGWSIEKVFTGSYRFGVSDDEADQFGMNFNANALGGICNMALICLLQIRMRNKQNKLDVILMIACIFFGMMTMSRSFIVCLLFICILMVFCGKKEPDKIFKRLAYLIVVLLVLIALIYLIIPTVIESFLKRFEEEDISNGRVDLFGYYLDIILNNSHVSLFGIGLQNIPQKVETLFGGYFGVPHNGIQEIVLIWGIPGLILFVWFFVIMTKDKCSQYKLQNLMPLLFLLLHSQFGHIITSGISLLMLVIIHLSMIQDNHEIIGEQKTNDEK